MDRHVADVWVEIEHVELRAGERAPQCPEDTARRPYMTRVRGTLVGTDATLGQTVRVSTPSGREMTGTLVTILPGYHHGFGEPSPAWIQMREAIRRTGRELARRSGSPEQANT